MPWYSYLFFGLALIVFIFGMPHAARKGNTAALIHCMLLLSLWFGLGLWTGGFLE